ncbi:unnamed protein product [Leptidea sinapis]|uniref:Uncharacterized protein n=1 Tax=Leptidea sinapis TaxID=189913 RepID=A0A5E4QVP7_9NEOP|nr:unnamed protein product [Leptidea sinapis]
MPLEVGGDDVIASWGARREGGEGPGGGGLSVQATCTCKPVCERALMAKPVAKQSSKQTTPDIYWTTDPSATGKMNTKKKMELISRIKDDNMFWLM